MSEYSPDKWVILKITPDEGKPIYKILAGWYGGFAGSNSWKLSSGISGAEVDEGYWRFPQCSGSVYLCHPRAYGFSGMTSNVLAGWVNTLKGATIEVMPEGFKVPTEDYCEVV